MLTRDLFAVTNLVLLTFGKGEVTRLLLFVYMCVPGACEITRKVMDDVFGQSRLTLNKNIFD